jgi:hypothetical protein
MAPEHVPNPAELDDLVRGAGNPHAPRGSFDNPRAAEDAAAAAAFLAAAETDAWGTTPPTPAMPQSAQNMLEQLFQPPVVGALEGSNLQEIEGVQSALACASMCTELGGTCRSFDFSAVYSRCYLGSAALDGGSTNGASQFLYYERRTVPGGRHAAAGEPLHGGAFDLMKDALDELRGVAERQAEHTKVLLDSHNKASQDNADIDAQQDALHSKIEAHNERVVEEIHDLIEARAPGTAAQHCPPGYSGTGCLDFTTIVRSPQHVLHHLQDTKAAHTTLLVASASLNFKSAVRRARRPRAVSMASLGLIHGACCGAQVLNFPAGKLMRLEGRTVSEDAPLPVLANIQGVEVQGALTEAAIDSVAVSSAHAGSCVDRAPLRVCHAEPWSYPRCVVCCAGTSPSATARRWLSRAASSPARSRCASTAGCPSASRRSPRRSCSPARASTVSSQTLAASRGEPPCDPQGVL